MDVFYPLMIGLHIFLCFIGIEVLATQEINPQNYQQGKYNDVPRYQKSQIFMWKEFKNKYNKTYSVEEEHKRFKIFRENLNTIEKHNKLYERGLFSYNLGINKYADMDHKEFVKIMNGYNPSKTDKPTRTIDHIQYMSPLVKMNIPDEVDWRKHGYVTPVKNQGACGSCWAFSSTGSLEGQHFRKTMKLISLSEQNLVDCTHKWGNKGCDGGWMDNAFQYIKDNGGIDTEHGYPYLGKDEKKCYFNGSYVGATDKGFVDIVPRGNENKLKEAVASIGPISVAIDAGHGSFMFYGGGIYDEPECHNNVTSLDHAVLVVGYGTKDSKDYWLVKNSWDTDWGVEGYIYMSRNKHNQCGIATRASYPLV